MPKKSKTIPCTFVSVWDDDVELRSKALYNPKTHEIEVLETVRAKGIDVLTKEYIVIHMKEQIKRKN